MKACEDTSYSEMTILIPVFTNPADIFYRREAEKQR